MFAAKFWGEGVSSRFRPKSFGISWGVWKKKKTICAGGGTWCANGKRKKTPIQALIKGNMGKVAKMAVFGNFAPCNLKTEKNDIAYHVGIFF